MRLLHGGPYEDGLLKLDKITLESYHFSAPRGLWSVQWVCNQVTDLLGLTNGKKLRTKRMTTQLKRVMLELLEASGRHDEIEDNFRDSQRSLRAAREAVRADAARRVRAAGAGTHGVPRLAVLYIESRYCTSSRGTFVPRVGCS